MLDKRLIRKWCDAAGCRPSFYGESPKLIILGENHYDDKHKENAEELIALVRPEFILYECLGAMIYDPKSRQVRRHPDVPHMPFIDDLESTVEDRAAAHMMGVADRMGVPVIGIDLSLGEAELYARGLHEIFPDISPTSRETKEREFQETRQAERMLQYEKKATRQMIAVIGNYHRRPGSLIHPILKGAGIGYACIYQPSSLGGLALPLPAPRPETSYAAV
jgi:hypothetical protein